MNEEIKKNNQSKYDALLNELGDSRNKLTEMLTEIEGCKNAVLDTAKSNDYRNKYAKEERIKTISAFYSLLLQTRQEYTRNIISEIELRRKLEKGSDNEVEIDITKIAKQLESVRKTQKKIEDSKLLKPAQILMENSK
jgi:hypothetical protein